MLDERLGNGNGRLAILKNLSQILFENSTENVVGGGTIDCLK